MNERIRELAEQAGLEYDFNPMLWLKYEKFAELIVGECAKFAFAYTGNRKNVRAWDEHGWDCLPGDLQDAIKKHFGIEE